MKNQRTEIRYLIFIAFSLLLIIPSCLIFSALQQDSKLLSERSMIDAAQSIESIDTIGNSDKSHHLLQTGFDIVLNDLKSTPRNTLKKSTNTDCDDNQTLTAMISVFGKLSLAFLAGVIISDGLFIRIGVL
jgi:hypothetical protein